MVREATVWENLLLFGFLFGPVALAALVALGEVVTALRAVAWLVGCLWGWAAWALGAAFWFVYAVWLPMSLLGFVFYVLFG